MKREPGQVGTDLPTAEEPGPCEGLEGHGGARTPITLPTGRRDPLDLPAEFQSLRARQPVAPLAFPDGPPGWLVTRYDDVRAGLADPRLSSSRPHLNSHVRASLISEGDGRAAPLRPAHQ
ncbi:hypothetical protein [Streptomyces sp. NPDC003863]